MKELIVLDLDGTLAESKSALGHEMVALLDALLDVAKVAVTSGGNWPHFDKQVVAKVAPGLPGRPCFMRRSGSARCCRHNDLHRAFSRFEAWPERCSTQQPERPMRAFLRA